MPPRLTHATALILKALASGHRYGFDVMDATGLPSGTVYPALRRLDRAGMVEARWEEDVDPSEVKRPRRRMYALTGDGRAMLADADRRLRELARFLPGAGEAPAGGSGA